MNGQTTVSTFWGGGVGVGVESGINGEEGACDRYYGVGLLNSCPLKLLA